MTSLKEKILRWFNPPINPAKDEWRQVRSCPTAIGEIGELASYLSVSRGVQFVELDESIVSTTMLPVEEVKGYVDQRVKAIENLTGGIPAINYIYMINPKKGDLHIFEIRDLVPVKLQPGMLFDSDMNTRQPTTFSRIYMEVPKSYVPQTSTQQPQ